MDHLLTRIFHFRCCCNEPHAARAIMLAFFVLFPVFSTVAAQDSLTVSERLAASKRATWASVPDTLVVKKDTTQLLLVTTAPDTTVESPDSVRVQEIHPQDSPVDRGFLIRTSDGSAELRIRGSVRLNGIFDLNGLQTQSTFNTYEIPVGEANISQPRFQMRASETRLGLEAMRKFEEREIFVKVESDFLGSSNTLRLRHAYVTIYDFLVGQTWSTFSDLTAIPLTVDLDGPNGSASERNVQIRYMSEIHEGLTWDASIESPNIEITIPDSVTSGPTYQSYPDVIGRVRQSGDWGHVQLAGVLRSITASSLGGGQSTQAGYGLLLSGRIFLGGETPHRLLFQLVGGRAISRYIGTLAKKGLDVVYNPVTGYTELVLTVGGYLSYVRQWTPSLLSYFTAGFVRIRNVEDQPDQAFRFSRYVSGNIFWEAAPGTRLGAEYSWGMRTNKDWEYGTATRFSFNLIYDF